MADEVGAGNISEAMRLFEQYKRERGMLPPEAPQDTAEQGFGALYQRAFETVAKPLGAVVGGLSHVAGIPARAVAAIGTNMSDSAAPVDVSDYALLGQDMETGAPAAHYGDILAGHLAETGEIAAGGAAEKFIRMAGNMVTDPAVAPLMLSGAEAAGSLAGRLPSPGMPNVGARPGGGQPPRSTLHPQYGPMPGSQAAGSRPPAGPAGGGGGAQMPGPRPPRAPAGGPNATQPFDPNATQPVRGVERVGGEYRDPGATQPVKTIKPTGSSMEAKFVAKRAEGRPSGGLESKFAKTRAPKEANYKKGGKAKSKGGGKEKPDKGLARHMRKGTERMKAYDKTRGPKAARGPEEGPAGYESEPAMPGESLDQWEARMKRNIARERKAMETSKKKGR